MNPNHLLGVFEILSLRDCFKSLVKYGTFEKAAGGGQGRSPAVSISEFILTLLKTIYFFCFWFSWMTYWRRVNPLRVLKFFH